jgi:hypothetical protein
MGTVDRETPAFPLLNEACGGAITLEGLQALAAHRPWLRGDIAAELDTFMAAGRAMFAPVEAPAGLTEAEARDWLETARAEIPANTAEPITVVVLPTTEGEGR